MDIISLWLFKFLYFYKINVFLISSQWIIKKSIHTAACIDFTNFYFMSLLILLQIFSLMSLTQLLHRLLLLLHIWQVYFLSYCYYYFFFYLILAYFYLLADSPSNKSSIIYVRKQFSKRYYRANKKRLIQNLLFQSFYLIIFFIDIVIYDGSLNPVVKNFFFLKDFQKPVSLWMKDCLFLVL